MSKLTAILLILLTLGACSGGKTDNSVFRDLPAEGWAYGDTVYFVPDTVDSVSRGTISIELRHNNYYEFSNLWLEICYPDGDRVHRDTVNLTLADVYGRWHGSGFGASYQFSAPFASQITLHRGDTVRVRHIMRVDTLRGLEKLGLNFRGRPVN